MATSQIYADLNPNYPARGERRYALFARENGSKAPGRKLPGSISSRVVAERKARTLSGRLPVRDDMTECQYHRPPTSAEIKFGEGATHYRSFPVDECCYPGTRIKKLWLLADDGLRYYR